MKNIVTKAALSGAESRPFEPAIARHEIIEISAYRQNGCSYFVRTSDASQAAGDWLPVWGFTAMFIAALGLLALKSGDSGVMWVAYILAIVIVIVTMVFGKLFLPWWPW